MFPGRPVILLAPDSFKESMTAARACEALRRGLASVLPEARFLEVPMADGGEGTTRSLVDACNGTTRTVRVTGPLGAPVVAEFGLLPDGTAVAEMASASGLMLVPPQRRNPRITSTRGTGELVRAILDAGARSLILGIGGSATNDGGAGFARALGVRFLDARGRELAEGGAALASLDRVDASGMDPRLAALSIQVACDVDNPLCGSAGASAVYAPQKGGSPDAVEELDAALRHYAGIIARDLGREVLDVPGSGAAGGLGAALLAFTNARLRPGVEIVIEATHLVDAVAAADLVVTGEGRLDSQTRHGKTPAGVARVARTAGKPVIAVAGGLGDSVVGLVPELFDAVVPIVPRPCGLADALADGPANLEDAAAMIGRLLVLGARL